MADLKWEYKGSHPSGMDQSGALYYSVKESIEKNLSGYWIWQYRDEQPDDESGIREYGANSAWRSVASEMKTWNNFTVQSPIFKCFDGIDNDGDGQIDYPNDSGCNDSSDNDKSNCGDLICEGGETCDNCIADCGACSNCSATDVNSDGVVDISELIYYIGQWKVSNVTISELMEAIGFWKSGC